MNGRERYFKNINLPFHCCSGGMAEWSGAALFFADEAVVQVQIQFFFPLAFYCLFLQLTLLASRDFCENVFLVNVVIAFFSYHKVSSSHGVCNSIFLLSQGII